MNATQGESALPCVKEIIMKTFALAAAAAAGLMAMPAGAAPLATPGAHANPYAPVLSESARDHDDWGRRGYGRGYGEYRPGDYYRGDRYRDDRYRDSYRGDRYYRGDYVGPNTRIWRGRDNRYYCRRDNGTTGLLIGGAAGAVIGSEVAGRGGDRTLGALLGGLGGALLGREIDRSDYRCR